MNAKHEFPGHAVSIGYDNNFEGTGMREDGPDLTADIAEDLARELPTPPPATTTYLIANRRLFERQIADQRTEKAKQQAIASAASAKARQLTVSIRSLEDALDSLLASEA